MFLFRESEHEVGRKAVYISAYLLIQSGGRHTVKLCQVGIKDYPFTTNGSDDIFDAIDWNICEVILHAESVLKLSSI